MILKLDIGHQGLKVDAVYINDGPGMTLPYYTARSKSVLLCNGMGKTVRKSIDGKYVATIYQIDRGLMFMEKFDHRQLSVPAPGLYMLLFQTSPKLLCQ